MANQEEEKSYFQSNLEHYRNLFSCTFRDLLHLSEEERDLFEEIYYNRDREIDQFDVLMESIKETAQNVTITGEAGIGKSNFVYKLIFNQEALEKACLFPMIIDFRTVAPRSETGCLLTFTEQIERYFDHQGHPINNLLDNTEENIKTNFHRIKKHFESIEKEKFSHHLIIFIDDLDYAEDEWYNLLSYLLPFAGSNRVSFILTARPTLFASIRYYDDRYSLYFTRNVKRIQLEPLSVNRVISKRLAPVLLENKTNPFMSFLKPLFGKGSRYAKVLRKLGIKNLDELRKFDYPFTHKHDNFMTTITNGNLREIFDIAFESLVYILEKYNELDERIEDAIPRKIIGREGVLKLFYDDKNASYRIINLHNKRSRKGNSLLFNVLEAVSFFEVADEKFFDTLQEFGHNETKVNWALGYLMEKLHRLIVPIKLLPQTLLERVDLYREFKITEKGEYYLNNMVFWDEYITRCGEPGKSLKVVISQ